jgi:hypothetical protein
MVTIKTATKELGVARRTVYLWVEQSTEEQVHRERLRIPDAAGRMVLTLVVDLEALRAYGDTR